ncbi:family 78 glycoside hydrolase catalytic domain [Arthrobacter sp. ISL-30]|uniref:family 78 glycoside hydrolase catalytic domain n=1 Tax=Arthrobacter sp. ISL-30 TaxID=2819109 RepID=UPI001BE51A93|nr:family 78 glycoside hydrolase catalytic domain [Arthrobacter sp. ISL-30]MBT2514529.1 family 78 glycoside hydrolase catalytic domain [Arthrobacter sp. ISL-30]
MTAGVAAQSSLTPEELLTEGLPHCLTATAHPHFGWRLSFTDGGRHDLAFQSAYRLLVRDSVGSTVWDSGVVASPQQDFVPYAGPALAPDRDYSWTVCVTDAAGVVSHWAEPTGFSTGLFQSAEISQEGVGRESDESEPDAAGWAAEWIQRRPGGRAPLERFDGVLRVSASPHLPLPCDKVSAFTLEARLRLRVGSAGILIRCNGPASGLLLEFDAAGNVVLRPAAPWEVGASKVPDTGILARGSARDLVGGAEETDAAARTAREAGGWHDVVVIDDGASVAVDVDGRRVLEVSLPGAAPVGLALHQGPRSHAEYARLKVSSGASPANHGVLLNSDFSQPEALAGWDLTTPHRQPDEWTLARTDVKLSGTVVRARLFAAAGHQARLYLNGERCLDTVSFGYPGEHYYDAADITSVVNSALRAAEGVGENTLTLAARAHWYGPGQGRAAGVPGLLVQLNVEYDDGRREVFGTGPDWVVAEGPYRQSGYRNDEGDPLEHFDATAAAATFDPSQGQTARWFPAQSLGRHPVPAFPKLTARRTFLAEHRVSALRILSANDGTPVADFGRVIPGRPVVDFADGTHGRTILLRAGYNLGPDGRVDTGKSASQNTDMSFPYMQVFGPQRYEAVVHLGFRYLELPGVEAREIGEVGAVVVHAEHPHEGSFQSSDPVLDEVFGLLRDSALLGVQEQFVDTPTREKGQFLGDAVNISYATMTLFGERRFTAQALREFASSAVRYWNDPSEKGRYNAVYPNGDGKRDIPDFSLMMPEWVAEYFRLSGDRGLVEELLPHLRGTADYVLRHIPAEGPTAGLVTHLGGGSGPYLHGIVDWPAPGRFGYDMQCAARTTVNAQAWSVLDSVAWLCSVMGRERVGASYSRHAADLASAIDGRLRVEGVMVDGLRADGQPSAGISQHATSFPLSFGITPPEFARADAARLESLGMRQGPMTVHLLFRALLAEGRTDAVLDLLTNTDQPGWARQLRAGATFTWEAWELEEGTDYSQSHGWSASVIREILGYVLGIRPAGFGTGAGSAPGFAGGGAALVVGPVVFEPPVCRLEYASGSVPLQQGLATAAWARTSLGTELDCTLPAGLEGEIRLPAGRYSVTGPAGAAAPPSGLGTADGPAFAGGPALADGPAPRKSRTIFRVPPGTWSFRPEQL